MSATDIVFALYCVWARTADRWYDGYGGSALVPGSGDQMLWSYYRLAVVWSESGDTESVVSLGSLL